MLTAPWWKLALIQGTFFGVSMAVCWRLYDRETPIAISITLWVIAGIVFGVIMGRISARNNQQIIAASGLTDRDEIQQAARASRRGPVPADPHIRQAAHKMAMQFLVMSESQRKSSLACFGIGTPVYLVVAFLHSFWWLLAAAVFAVMFVRTLRQSDRLARRVIDLGPAEELSEAPREYGDENHRHHQADHE
ncbi:hypothetical protein GCM10022223_06500 [Kineosporia mesophila]|uniref:Uncharacterized protein n=2 Tax=Kineosporia mesophila TaxID=566012 RepID=A0ABP6Z1B8_9ACTN